MSYLFINPIDFIVGTAPTHSVPLLMGILKNKGIETSYVNLNSLLLKDFKNKKFRDSICSIFTDIVEGKITEKNPLFNDVLSLGQKNLSEIPFEQLINSIPLTMSILNNKMLYYNLFFCNYSYMVLYKTIKSISFFYSKIFHIILPDCESCRTNVQNRDFSLDFNLINDFLDSKLNLLKDFHDKHLSEIMNEDVEVVGISINTIGQFLTGLYVCQYIKKHYKCHINIGGSFFNEFYNNIQNLSDLFNYFDSVSVKNSTDTVVDLVKYVRGEKNISDIPNIMYYNQEIKFNKGSNTYNYNKIPFIDLGKIEKDDYTLPHLVMPIQASTSCYWRKCIFCDCSANDEGYTIKTVSRLVDEIEYLKKKYKSKYFYFWDNALHPKYLEKLADELNKRKIKIVFSIYARFEEEFNYPLLKKLREAGLVHVCWGLDSASKRVMEYIHKGIKLENVERIIREADKANIYSKVYLIFGHPTETLEEVKETVDFINKQVDYIGDVSTNKKVFFLQNAVLQQNRDYYKSLIRTTEGERMKYISQIHKDSSGCIVTSFSPTCLLYLDKYSRHELQRRIKNYYNLQKYKIVRTMFLNVYNFANLFNFFREKIFKKPTNQ